MTPSPHPPPVIIIRPPRGWNPPDWAELWRFRELVWMLASRDLKVHYKQTVLGILWAVLPPLLMVGVFSLIFSTLSHAPTLADVPYALSTFCAMVPWQFFANAMNKAGNSLVHQRALITKVYFPRVLAPLALVLSSLSELLIALVVLVGMIGVYHLTGEYSFEPTWRLATLPLLTLLALLSVLALALLASALNAVYRDFQYLLRFGVQFLFFVTPVLYPAHRLLAERETWVLFLYGLNPMAGVVEGFRWAVFGGQGSLALVGLAVVVAALLLGLGLFAFQRMERLFADLV